MSTINSEVISDLGDVLSAMAVFAGGSIPAETTTQYTQWVRWIQLAQYDACRRGFWSRCLISADLAIVKDEQTAELPANFFKRNGIYVLNVGDEDWNSNANSSGQKLLVYKDSVTAKWMVRFGTTPTESATGTLWYFYNPPMPVDQDDAIWLDGEMIMYGALKEYFRQSRQAGSQDDARNEYENRFNENLNLEMLPTPQELMGWTSVYQHTGLDPMSEIHKSTATRNRS